MVQSAKRFLDPLTRRSKGGASGPTTRGTILSTYFLLAIVAVVVYALVRLPSAADPIVDSRRAGVAALFGGLAAASLIEIVKRATSFRGALQQYSLHRHFGDVAANAVKEPLRTPARPRRRLQVSNDVPTSTPVRNALYYSTSVDQLTAQLSELAERAVAAPSDNEKLLKALAGRTNESKASDYTQKTREWGALDESRPLDESPDDTPTEGNELADGGMTDDARMRDLAELAASLRSEIEGRIDAFQVTVDAQWRLLLRLAGCGLSAIAAGFIGAGIHLDTPGKWAAVAAGLTIGTAASWVTTDLLAMIHRAGG